MYYRIYTLLFLFSLSFFLALSFLFFPSFSSLLFHFIISLSGSLLAYWILKTLGRWILHLWDTIIHPLPKVLPGQLPTEDQLEDFYRSPQWARLAYRTKRRYGWRCMRCGATPPARIVTDHVKSLRYNWELGLKRSNCQVLCEACNWEKGSKDETDYRPVSWIRRLMK